MPTRNELIAHQSLLEGDHSKVHMPRLDAIRRTYVKGSRNGAVVRALAFHQCDPGSIPGLACHHLWVEFVIGSHSCSEGSPVFLPPQKPTLQIPIQLGKRG